MNSGEHEVCTEFSHAFLDYDTVYVVGYQCSSVWLFVGVVLASFVLVVVQVKVGVRDGQASRMALATRRGSPERKRILRKILTYTAISSALSIVHTVLVVGLNLYVLVALTAGNIYGVWTSYARQEADEHCSTSDICSWLTEAQIDPQSEKFKRLRHDLRVFLLLEQEASAAKRIEQGVGHPGVAPRRRQIQMSAFVPYADFPSATPEKSRQDWKL